MRIEFADYDIEHIITQAKDNGMDYLDLSVLWENRKYTVNSYLIMWEHVLDIINTLHAWTNRIVQYLLEHPQELYKILHPKIVEVIKKKPGEISPHQRRDLLVDINGNLKVVEVNSETPAWLPESLNSYLFDPYVQLPNANEKMRDNITRTFKRLWYKDVDVVFSDDSVWMFHRVGEDYTNAWYLATFRKWRMINAGDIYLTDHIIEAYDKPIKRIHTFYPLEWFFLDEGSNAFWDLYLKWEFALVNWPINLITQSKAFRARCWENLDIVESCMDINVFKCFVPRYTFHKRDYAISKPRLFREGVGIGKNLEWSVYQDYITQKQFKCKTFEWVKEWYLTVWVYTNQTEVTWVYTRFCESKITDYTAYFLPTYLQNENFKSMSSIASSPSSRMMFG